MITIIQDGDNMFKHRLKTLPGFFKAVEDGTKTFEVRKDDRGFQVGDILELLEYEVTNNSYSGRQINVEVTYKLSDPIFGIRDGYCVLGIKKI